MKPKNKATYALWGLFILLALYSIKIASKNTDFTVFIEAGNMIARGESPYHKWIFVSEGNFCLYFYSPFWAMLLIPFSYLPQFVVQYLWLLLNLFFLYRSGKLLLKYGAGFGLSEKQVTWLLAITLLFGARFILYNFEMIQMTLFLLWGSLEALNLDRRGAHSYAAILLAFIINVKILPLVFLPYFFFRKSFKTAGLTLLFSLLFLTIPVWFLGWETNTQLLADWWSAINPSNSEHQLEVDLGPHSLTVLIPVLLTSTEGILASPRNILDLTVDQAVLVLNIVRAILILSVLWFLNWVPFREAKSTLHQLYEISYLCLLIPLIFPHQQKYAFIMAVPAAFYLVGFMMSNGTALTKPRRNGVLVFLIISFALMTLTTDGLVGRSLNELFQHYKLLTYGTLALIPALALARPKYLNLQVD